MYRLCHIVQNLHLTYMVLLETCVIVLQKEIENVIKCHKIVEK